jgi:predicted ester cyclase
MRFTLNGTDLGGHAGRPATGRTITEWAINIMRFENDRVVSEWMGADKLGVFIQLGVFEDPWPQHGMSG